MIAIPGRHEKLVALTVIGTIARKRIFTRADLPSAVTDERMAELLEQGACRPATPEESGLKEVALSDDIFGKKPEASRELREAQAQIDSLKARLAEKDRVADLVLVAGRDARIRELERENANLIQQLELMTPARAPRGKPA